MAAALDGLSREDSDIRGRLTALREQLVDHHAKRDELTERTSRVQIALKPIALGRAIFAAALTCSKIWNALTTVSGPASAMCSIA